MAASRLEIDDGRSSTVNDRSPSPLSTSQGSTDAQFTNSFFAPVSRLASVDSDVHITDATDSPADTSAAARLERFTSPLSASAAATNGRKLGRGGAASAVPRRGGGGGTASKTPSSRGGNGRGLPATRGGRGVAKPKPKAISANQGRFANSSARSSASPRVKRERDTDDDGDNEEDDEDSDSEGIAKKRNAGARRIATSDDEDDDNDNSSMQGAGRMHGNIRRDGETNTSDSGPYCICRGPDDHRWMIQCDDCEDWYHGDCVNIEKEDGETMIRSYICPLCTIPGRYETRYKKLCSFPNCRKAARLYDNDGSGGAATPQPAEYSNHFCSSLHRDQWWDALLARMGRARPVAAAAEAKLAVDQFTPAQLITVLLHTDEPGVAQMLLHGLPQDTDGSLDAVLTNEELETMQKSTADRDRFAEQIEMCKKMLRHLDMTKARHQEAVKAGHIERDACGYDVRLQHIAAQPHYEMFLASPEGVAISHSETLSAPQFDDAGDAVDSRAGCQARADGSDAGDASEGDDPEVLAATAGMCGKRKCKAHSNWFSTLARDVRTQIQEFSRQIAMLLDNETRIRLAAVQRSFIKQHSSSEVQRVDDSDNSLTSLASDDDDSDDGDPKFDNDKESGHAGSPEYKGYSRTLQTNGSHGNDDSRIHSRYGSRSPNSYTGTPDPHNSRLHNGHSQAVDGRDEGVSSR